MGDGAREITKAGEEVFGDEGARLMCWPHTYRKIIQRLTNLKKVNGKIQQELLHDIESLQWSCHSEHTFDVVFTLLERKYLIDNKHKCTAKENDVLGDFFHYLREQWGTESHVSGMRGPTHGAPHITKGLRVKTKVSRKTIRLSVGVLLELLWTLSREW